MERQLSLQFNKAVSGLLLGIFRAFFGLVLIGQFSSWFKRIESYQDESFLHFPFYGLEFIEPFSPTVLTVFLYSGILAATFVAVGYFTRIALAAIIVLFGYFLFLDQLYFNNHYYLFWLICILLTFTQSDAQFSLRNLKSKIAAKSIPLRDYWILRLQFIIVFFYGGLAKLNTEWLSGSVTDHIVGSSLGLKGGALNFSSAFLCYGGLAFDLGIGFFLVWKKTRYWAIALGLLFNAVNGWLLFEDIHLFPIAMSAGLFLFADPDRVAQFFAKRAKSNLTKKEIKKLKKQNINNKGEGNWEVPDFPKWSKGLSAVLAIYFLFQFLFPLRHYIAPGYVDWTGQGYYFSWRMKSFAKDVKFNFKAYDPSNTNFLYDLNLPLNAEAQNKIGVFPHTVWLLAQEVRNKIKQSGGQTPAIRVEYSVAMNGRKVQKAIDTSVDFGRVNYRALRKNDWVLDLKPIVK